MTDIGNEGTILSWLLGRDWEEAEFGRCLPTVCPVSRTCEDSRRSLEEGASMSKGCLTYPWVPTQPGTLLLAPPTAIVDAVRTSGLLLLQPPSGFLTVIPQEAILSWVLPFPLVVFGHR